MANDYHAHVGASNSAAFTTLLLRWRGSLYKVVYKDLLLFLILFGAISAIYRNALNDSQKKTFESIALYFQDYLSMSPLSFIMGFYVTTIVTRWWDQFMALPWPDRLILCINLYLPGADAESRCIRWNLLRYATLMLVLILQQISESVRKKYPELEDLVSAGFMTKQELECYSSITTDVDLFWVPGTWFANLLRQCRVQGRVDFVGVKLIMEQLLGFREKCCTLWNYNMVSIPLVYTQVVTIATHTFFLACLFGRQSLDSEKAADSPLPVDKYFPLWTSFEFLFYFGLLRVAEQMINPHGDDDEDFELNYLIQRHMKAIRLAAQVLAEEHPPLQKLSTVHFNIKESARHRPYSARPLSRSLSIQQPRNSATIYPLNQ